MIKKSITIFFCCLIICMLCSCGDKQEQSITEKNGGINQGQDIQSEDTPTETFATYTEIEKSAIEYFDLIQSNIETNGANADITNDFEKLVELKNQNMDNKIIKNLCQYCYIQYEILLAKKYDSSAGIWDIKSAVSSIEDDYNGYFSKEILQFKKEVENYTDEEWAKYLNVNIPTIIKKEDVDKYPEIIYYDAILKATDYNRVIVATSYDVLERYIQAGLNGHSGTIKELEDNLQVLWVVNGHKCNIIEKKDSLCKVKILTGNMKDKIVWTTLENVKSK